jgi:hypothetical protein
VKRAAERRPGAARARPTPTQDRSFARASTPPSGHSIDPRDRRAGGSPPVPPDPADRSWGIVDRMAGGNGVPPRSWCGFLGPAGVYAEVLRRRAMKATPIPPTLLRDSRRLTSPASEHSQQVKVLAALASGLIAVGRFRDGSSTNSCARWRRASWRRRSTDILQRMAHHRPPGGSDGRRHPGRHHRSPTCPSSPRGRRAYHPYHPEGTVRLHP